MLPRLHNDATGGDFGVLDDAEETVPIEDPNLDSIDLWPFIVEKNDVEIRGAESPKLEGGPDVVGK